MMIDFTADCVKEKQYGRVKRVLKMMKKNLVAGKGMMKSFIYFYLTFPSYFTFYVLRTKHEA